MKVKHYQGYGSVEMKKTRQSINNGIKTITVQVSGNHEWGLRRNDVYDVFNWICKRLGKDCKSYTSIIDLCLNSYSIEVNGKTVEACDYIISYKI